MTQARSDERYAKYRAFQHPTWLVTSNVKTVATAQTTIVDTAALRAVPAACRSSARCGSSALPTDGAMVLELNLKSQLFCTTLQIA
eukprot:1186707-Rhodomonas_salina.1